MDTDEIKTPFTNETQTSKEQTGRQSPRLSPLLERGDKVHANVRDMKLSRSNVETEKISEEQILASHVTSMEQS